MISELQNQLKLWGDLQGKRMRIGLVPFQIQIIRRYVILLLFKGII